MASKDGDEGLMEKAEEAGGEKEKSFARRPPPKKEATYALWVATRDAFQDKVALYVDYPSKFEDHHFF